MRTKKVIVLGAGHYQINVMKSIGEIGYYVIAIDKNPNSPGFKYADEYAIIDISDRFAIYEFAKKNGIDGIMAINDIGAISAFFASQNLGLINPSYLSGICSNDKGIMRDVWKHDKLPQPDYLIFSDKNDIWDIDKVLDYPIVIKPTYTGGGGRGISVAYNRQDLISSIFHARPFCKNNRYIAEKYMDGIEVTVDSLVYKGQVYTLAISDKEKPKSKYFVATSLNFPADFPELIIDKIKNIVTIATDSFGVSNGATHAELIVDGEDIRLVEMGIRGGGGHLFNTIIEAVSGVNAPQELAKILCGDEPKLQTRYTRGVCYRFFNPNNKGRIKSIQYDEKLVRSDFVLDFGITAKVGDSFDGLIDSMKRVGYVVTAGANREEAVRNADLIENNTFFEI